MSKTTYTNLIDVSEKVLWDVQVLWIAIAYNMKISVEFFRRPLSPNERPKDLLAFQTGLHTSTRSSEIIWLVDA